MIKDPPFVRIASILLVIMMVTSLIIVRNSLLGALDHSVASRILPPSLISFGPDSGSPSYVEQIFINAREAGAQAPTRVLQTRSNAAAAKPQTAVVENETQPARTRPVASIVETTLFPDDSSHKGKRKGKDKKFRGKGEAKTSKEQKRLRGPRDNA